MNNKKHMNNFSKLIAIVLFLTHFTVSAVELADDIPLEKLESGTKIFFSEEIELPQNFAQGTGTRERSDVDFYWMQNGQIKPLYGLRDNEIYCKYFTSIYINKTPISIRSLERVTKQKSAELPSLTLHFIMETMTPINCTLGSFDDFADINIGRFKTIFGHNIRFFTHDTPHEKMSASINNAKIVSINEAQPTESTPKDPEITRINADKKESLKPQKPQKPTGPFKPTRENIKEVQKLLAELGYKPGPADGLLGRGSRREILAYKRKNNIRRNSKITLELIESLRKATHK